MENISEITAMNSNNVSVAIEEQLATIKNFASSAEEVSATANELESLVEHFNISGE